MAEGAGQAPESRGYHLPDPGPGSRRPSRLLDAAQQGNGEGRPPDGDAEEGQAQREPGAGKQEPVRVHDPEQVDDQQDAAADVPHGVAAGRDAVEVAGAGHVRQQRLVEDVARGEPDVAGDEEDRPGQVAVVAEEDEQGRGADPEAGEEGEEPLLAGGLVAERSEGRPDDGDYEQGEIEVVYAQAAVASASPRPAWVAIDR